MNKLLCTKIGESLKKKKKTLAVAESVTSGRIQSALSLGRDASKFFQGGITAYNLGQKTRHLLVEPIEAENSDCVSQKVSSAMALNVCKLFLSDYGLGITGYASLVPEENINALYAFVSIARDGRIVLTKKITAKKQKQEDVQAFYTHEALHLLNTVL